ncbi:MAG: acetylglutamate kinase [Candidatus Omnitrophica bacterium]|nr:acetylglutamate kinase [Candidatus Omnitrophota bacterium]
MDEIVQKAGVLVEALPYIKKFRGKEVLIKYGGAAMDDENNRLNVLQDLVFMNYVGIKPILIHGGGPAITAALKIAGVESKFIDGLRVTDQTTIEVVVDTLGEINKNIVHDLNHLGARAIGLGHGNEILIVKKLSKPADVGFVGEVIDVNTKPIKEITDYGIIPVIYTIGLDEQGQLYNVNADEAAAKIAGAVGVQKMIVLTNVRGVLRNGQNPASLISSCSAEEINTMIKSGTIAGGMIPKVKACVTALNTGVRKAHIIDGRMPHSLLLEIFTDKGIGTEITP